MDGDWLCLEVRGEEGKMILVSKQFYIFGAHSRSQTLAMYLTTLFPGTKVIAFLIDNEEDNPRDVDGVPVVHIKNSCKLDVSLPVFLGTKGVSHKSIMANLEAIGFSEIIPVTQEMDLELRNAFIPMYYRQHKWTFQKLESADNYGKSTPLGNSVHHGISERLCIYVAKSFHDKPLKEKVELREYERGIQVGTALSEERLTDCRFFDNIGDHISMRNRQFCELTALYWIWKNSKETIVGLEHYRRHFLLKENWHFTMMENGVDVILPVPLYVNPSLAENYCQRHEVQTWKAMIAVLKEQGDMGQEALNFFMTTGCYSPCNMLIAKKEVLDELCQWLFPILFKTVEKIGEIPDSYQNRYPGFLSERLISFFFHYHRERYKVVYEDKNFVE